VLSGRDIVCVGFNDWDSELWTNQHHLMSRLAVKNRVLFIESLGLRRPTLHSRDVRRMGRRLVRGLRGPRSRDGLHVLSPLVLPLHRNRLARAVNRRLLPALVRRGVRRLGMSKPILWAYVPQAEALIAPLEPGLVVYHLVDDIAAHERIDRASFDAAEARLLPRAGVVIASSPPLARQVRQRGGNPVLLPNVADTALFAQALEEGPVEPVVSGLPPPRIVFTGAIAAAKVDLELLAELAERRPAWSFVLVGPVGLGDPDTDVSALAARPNVHLLGSRPQPELPPILRGADAAIIPYARNPLTDGIFPLKVYEYLAAGLPVLATPLPALRDVTDVTLADDAGQMIEELERALADDSPDRRLERSLRARANNWEARLEEISSLIEEAGIRSAIAVTR
jgi:glycosyltransferase involved in cell wall biosynthesis